MLRTASTLIIGSVLTSVEVLHIVRVRFWQVFQGGCTIVKERQDCVILCVCVSTGLSRRNTETGAQSFTQALLSITFEYIVCEIMAHPRSLETWVNIFYVLQIVHLLVVTIWVVVLARLFIVRLAHASAPPCPALPWWLFYIHSVI